MKKLIEKKKALRDFSVIKDNSGLERKVMLMEDLTALRCKLLAAAKECPDTELAFMKVGIIMEKKCR